jgi:glycosyltransferase involved in cell wall biosynthesis
MTYVLVNPFPWRRANGVTSYLRNLMMFLRDTGVRAVCISNDDDLPRATYQRFVRETITARFQPDGILVEAPDVKSPTLLLPPQFAVHIRLHCPNALVEAHNGWPVHWGEFAEEMEVVRTAHLVSSPSYALLRALEGYVDADAVHVYKNPPPWRVTPRHVRSGKTCDLVYLARFSPLKGTDSLAPLLRRLPGDVSVAFAGRESDRFGIPADARCSVTVHGEISGRRRLRFLRSGRISLLLSRFENCSMTILESLAVGTIVAGWRVGGNEEIAPPRLVRLVERDDVEALAATIHELRDEPHPPADEFRRAIAGIGEDFRRGWQHLWSAFQCRATAAPYRGMDASGRTDVETADPRAREWLRRAPAIPGTDLRLLRRAEGSGG